MLHQVAPERQTVGRVLRAIPTVYRGYTFRSRLEAKWAFVFDRLNIWWDYEPEGFQFDDGTRYLPDFWLKQVHMWVEVKPDLDPHRLILADEAHRKGVMLAEQSTWPVLFLDGSPRQTNYWAVYPGLPGDGWGWSDIDLFDANRYHETEGRFFASTGAPDLVHHTEPDVIHPAISAVRTWRFERGGLI